MNSYENDAENFGILLRDTAIKSDFFQFGSFLLPFKRGVTSSIQYNQREFEKLQNRHDYTIALRTGNIELSLQLYLNINDHFRLFAYVKAGMLFSVNLTTEKESDNAIFLTQRIKFAERYEGDEQVQKAFRRHKQVMLCHILGNLGIEVTPTFDVILGIFDPNTNQLLNTSPERFLNDFIMIALLKGHFMGNKDYQLDLLPELHFDSTQYFQPKAVTAEMPIRMQDAQESRAIPLSLRYKILARDKGKCQMCGRAAADGITLHIDHIKPFSHGGLTIETNLRVLCSECNIGRSNKYQD